MSDLTWIDGIGYMGGASNTYEGMSKIGYMAESKREVKSELGKNDFLSLLAAQLQYQNPLEPMNDSDFVAQLAQFSSLEQLENMSTAFTNLATTQTNNQAFSMVGKYVVANAQINGQKTELSGIVDCVFTENGSIYAQIGEYCIPIAAITSVINSDLYTLDRTLVDASNFIGREVTARVSKDGVIENVTGVVTRIAVEDGELYAYIDDGESGDKVLVKNIYDIKQVTQTVEETEKEQETETEDVTETEGDTGTENAAETEGGTGTENVTETGDGTETQNETEIED